MKTKLKVWKHNYNIEPSMGQKFKTESLTIPGQTKTIAELFMQMINGQQVPVVNLPYSGNEIPIVIKDLSDITNLQQQNRLVIDKNKQAVLAKYEQQKIAQAAALTEQQAAALKEQTVTN